uniref:PiggyBac transposable element-like protein n=1 Tax=Trachysalambria curvirostris nimavirus TaxID=2984282 RepID=A0A9C7BN28_9VIRU|nr:MAG: piggyBac transposable element-like protein [Trachysalambria curvirostris nimavirus]
MIIGIRLSYYATSLLAKLIKISHTPRAADYLYLSDIMLSFMSLSKRIMLSVHSRTGTRDSDFYQAQTRFIKMKGHQLALSVISCMSIYVLSDYWIMDNPSEEEINRVLYEEEDEEEEDNVEMDEVESDYSDSDDSDNDDPPSKRPCLLTSRQTTSGSLSCNSTPTSTLRLGGRRRARSPQSSTPADHDIDDEPEDVSAPENQDAWRHNFTSNTLVAKSGRVWHSTPRTRRNAPAPSYPSLTPGPTEAIDEAERPSDFFLHFFDNEMIGQIALHTNETIDEIKPKYKVQNAHTDHVTLLELRAVIGLLLFTGAKKDNHVGTHELWSLAYGSSLYRCVMSEQRFLFILRCLRFDDKRTREERKKKDNFAAIRGLWEKFIGHCIKNYEPGENVTIDEQLLAFRGRCSFKMHIPNEPAKYGLKIIMVCDAKSHYMFNASPYLGKGTITDKRRLMSHAASIDVLAPLLDTSRNVTMDNWFTTIPLLEELKEHGISGVGTIKRKPYIPNEIFETKGRRTKTTGFIYSDIFTLTSYNPKKNRTVQILSTRDHTEAMGNKQKAEIFHFYNKTKGGVDTFDQLCSGSTCSRKTRRWSLCVFYGILTSSAVNSHIVYNSSIPRTGGKHMDLRSFILEVGFELCRSFVNQRLSRQIPRQLKNVICYTFGYKPQVPVRPSPESRMSNLVHVFGVTRMWSSLMLRMPQLFMVASLIRLRATSVLVVSKTTATNVLCVAGRSGKAYFVSQCDDS